MIEFFKTMLGKVTFDKYIEGVYAHQYNDENLRSEILENYNKKYKPAPTPLSHPERFDPLNPPKGWAYDPFYEMWIEY